MPDSVTPGAVLDSKYRVERILGRGGMGMVVAARHLQLGELVAVKFMHAQAMANFDDADVRFRREAQAVASLHSENIARVIDGGTLPSGAPYIVMEYLDGVDLATVLQEHGPVAVTDTVDWVLQICAAMAEAHGHGIVHRDLKPANLFLTRGPSGMARVKVLDFGISKCQAEGEDALFQTSTIGTMGSPSYMSPEQARSAKLVDARTDIWSIGVILYHLMSGRLPFAAGSTAELFVQILHGAPEPLGEVAPWVPSRLSDMVMRCLAKEPGERCAGVIELGAALAPYASEQGRAWFAASPLAAAAMPNGRAWSEPGLTVPLAPTAEPDLFSSIVVEGPPPLELDEFLARVGSLSGGDLTVPHPPSAVSLGITMAGATTTSARLRPRRSTIIGVCSVLVVAIGLALLIGSSGRQRSTSSGTPAAHMEADSAPESKKTHAGEPENHPLTSADAGVEAASRQDPGQTAGRAAPDTGPPAAAATSRTRKPAAKATKSSRKKSSGRSDRRTNSRDRDRDNDNGQPPSRPGPFDSIQ